MRQFDHVVATFSPKRTDDLRPGTSELIGWRGLWQASWIIEEGPYKGQWAMFPVFRYGDDVPDALRWVPEEDLDTSWDNPLDLNADLKGEHVDITGGDNAVTDLTVERRLFATEFLSHQYGLMTKSEFLDAFCGKNFLHRLAHRLRRKVRMMLQSRRYIIRRRR